MNVFLCAGVCMDLVAYGMDWIGLGMDGYGYGYQPASERTNDI